MPENQGPKDPTQNRRTQVQVVDEPALPKEDLFLARKTDDMVDSVKAEEAQALLRELEVRALQAMGMLPDLRPDEGRVARVTAQLRAQGPVQKKPGDETP